MRSALFLGTFFIGINAASASSEIGAGSVSTLEELQRLAAESDDGRNQLDSPDALEKLQEAQRASQSFANRNFKDNEVGNGLLPNNDEPREEQSVDSSEDVEQRALEQETDFLAPRPQPEKAAVYRELQVVSTGSAGPEENGDQDELQNDLGQQNADENQPDIERNEIPEELEDHLSEANGNEKASSGDNEADGIGFMLEEKENELTDLEAPGNESTGSTEEESEEERSLGKRRYYYAAPKKTQPPPKKIAVAPKKAPPVKVPMKVQEKKVVPPPKKVHQKKAVAPKKAVRPAKKYVPVQKKAPPPKKVYAPPPKKVYAPPKKAYAPPPKKVYAPKKYVPVSKKGGY
ncbi:UNVERIFIED_CONTAM: hypothetical protein HHA_204520 [Hammondia hammondi]|eukprot:XP_008887417.1 hypothetical protein HHA_204520 [Hammondia hammondi]